MAQMGCGDEARDGRETPAEVPPGPRGSPSSVHEPTRWTESPKRVLSQRTRKHTHVGIALHRCVRLRKRGARTSGAAWGSGCTTGSRSPSAGAAGHPQPGPLPASCRSSFNDWSHSSWLGSCELAHGHVARRILDDGRATGHLSPARSVSEAMRWAHRWATPRAEHPALCFVKDKWCPKLPWYSSLTLPACSEDSDGPWTFSRDASAPASALPGRAPETRRCPSRGVPGGQGGVRRGGPTGASGVLRWPSTSLPPTTGPVHAGPRMKPRSIDERWAVIGQLRM